MPHISHLHSALGAAGDDPDEGSVSGLPVIVHLAIEFSEFLRDVGQSHMDIFLAWCRCQVRNLEGGAHVELHCLWVSDQHIGKNHV